MKENEFLDLKKKLEDLLEKDPKNKDKENTINNRRFSEN